MEHYIVKGGKKLRCGYTTGSCAAAAAKASAFMLLTGRRKEKIRLETPKGITLNLDILDISMRKGAVSCAVKKYSGDDPDITDGALIFAEVTAADSTDIVIDGGIGVGVVTKPGLDQPVGAAAINSVPRKMIRENLLEICRLCDYHGGLSVKISVPDGKLLAGKTFNPRLGIVGGISILGTSGIVEPMSEQALVDTIAVELRQRKADGVKNILLTPRNYGSDYIASIGIDPESAVLTSNFIGDALDICRELKFDSALLIGHIGKLVKTAGGMLNTHSAYGDCRMEILAAHAAAAGLPALRVQEILNCAACDDAVRILKENAVFEQTMKAVAEKTAFIMRNRVRDEMAVGAIFFSNRYGFLGETENARLLLRLITEG